MLLFSGGVQSEITQVLLTDATFKLQSIMETTHGAKIHWRFGPGWLERGFAVLHGEELRRTELGGVRLRTLPAKRFVAVFNSRYAVKSRRKASREKFGFPARSR